MTFIVPEILKSSALKLAQERDISLGQFFRDAALREIKDDLRRKKAKMPVRADERLVAPLRALLADDFAFAKSWHDLQSRLRAKGYLLQESGGGLVLNAYPAATRICKGSELGYGYRLLVRKFNAPFPGHRHKVS